MVDHPTLLREGSWQPEQFRRLDLSSGSHPEQHHDLFFQLQSEEWSTHNEASPLPRNGTIVPTGVCHAQPTTTRTTTTTTTTTTTETIDACLETEALVPSHLLTTKSATAITLEEQTDRINHHFVENSSLNPNIEMVFFQKSNSASGKNLMSSGREFDESNVKGNGHDSNDDNRPNGSQFYDSLERGNREETLSPVATTEHVPTAEKLHDDSDNNDDDDNDNDNDDGSFVGSDSHVRQQDLTMSNPSSTIAVKNFILVSILFGAVHGSSLVCLALATAQLGSTMGAWQNGALYLSYTLSALCGATYVAKQVGSRRAMMVGMWCNCIYVGCFVLALIARSKWHFMLAMMGAMIGGAGDALLWTGQGAYFTQAARHDCHLRHFVTNEKHQTLTKECSMSSGNSNLMDEQGRSYSHLAGIFAFVLLAEETVLDLLSTFFVRYAGFSWRVVFSIYFILTLLSTLAMWTVHEYPSTSEHDDHDLRATVINASSTLSSIFVEATASIRLLINDPKMKYMIGFNAAFGFAGAFLNSFVSGEVIPVALNDPTASYIGLLVAIHGATAALSSLGLDRIAQRIGNGPVLYMGCVAFVLVAGPFILQPDIAQYGWLSLIGIYVVEGFGRATFEGAFRAVMAEYFAAQDREGAFANISLQNGLFGALGYFWSVRWRCQVTTVTAATKSHSYCIPYRDGSWHNILHFSLLVVLTSIFAGLSLWKAAYMYAHEESRETSKRAPIPSNDEPNHTPSLHSLASQSCKMRPGIIRFKGTAVRPNQAFQESKFTMASTL